MLTDLSPKGGEVKDPSPCADHLTRFASLTDLSPKGGEVKDPALPPHPQGWRGVQGNGHRPGTSNIVRQALENAMRWIALVAVLASVTFAGSTWADDGVLGRKGGGGKGGGSSSGGGGSNPPARGGGGSQPRENPPVRGGGSQPRENPPVRGGGSQPRENPPARGGGGSQGDDGLLGRNRDRDSGRNQGSSDRTNPNRGSQGPLGRPERVGDTESMIRRNESRSGRTNYGSVNNRLTQLERSTPITIDRAPINVNRGSLERQALREGVPQRVQNNYRSGYYFYDNRWRDDYWCYPHYRFDWNDNCVVSPWYWYSHLPAYIVPNRCSFGRPGLSIEFRFDFDFGRWDRYDRYDRYDGYSSYSRGYDRQLGEAVDNLKRAFERRDMRCIEDLIPSRGEVRITPENGYSYWIDARDFYDLLADNVDCTQTRRYNILRVRYADRGEAKVLAEHEFVDAWGRRSTVYHFFTLTPDRYGYSIVEFEISRYRPRW